MPRRWVLMVAVAAAFALSAGSAVALFSQDVVYALAARTSAPSASDSVDLQSKGASHVVARFRATANGGSTDQRLVIQRQDSTDNATWLDAEGEVIIFDGTYSAAGSTYRDIKEFTASSRYHRWSPTHTGTTANLTWELVEAYR